MLLKGFLFVVALTWFAPIAVAKQIDSTVTGSWYNPQQDGHGFSVEYLNASTTLIYWYVYTPDGAPTFLVIAASNQGTSASGTAYIQEGMRFGAFDPDDVERTVWGTVTFTYNSCGSATLQYNSTDQSYGNGTIQLTKLVEVEGVKCKRSPLHGNYIVTLFDETTGIGAGGAIAFADGEMLWAGVDEQRAIVGRGTWQTTSGGNFTFSGNAYDVINGGRLATSGTGVIEYNGFQINGPDYGMQGVPSPGFQLSRRTRDLAGTHQLFDTIAGDVIGTLTVQQNGNTTGEIYNCTLNGAITSPFESFNQYRVNLQLGGCISPIPFVGGIFFDPDSGNHLMLAVDGTYGYQLLLQ